MKKKIIFRADGNAEIGMGHFVRSLALADMLKNDFYICFAIRTPSVYQKENVTKICSELWELPSGNVHFDYFLSLLDGNEIVVLDNYFYDTDYQHKIKVKGCRLVCLDDMHDKHYVADIVINHAPGLTPEMFSTEPYTQLCLGLSYALLRKPFLKVWEKIRHEGVNVFICFGGSDIHNLTQKCVDSIFDIENISEIYVVTGNACKHKKQLSEHGSHLPGIQVYSDLDADQMVELLRKSDMALIPASTILWETLSQNVPCVYGYYVDNQMDICKNAETNESLGMTCIGDFNQISSADLSDVVKQKIKTLNHPQAMSIGKSDGTAEHIRHLFASEITVRKANLNDMTLYFKWANDPDVRKFAFHPEQIDWNTHQKWFEKKSTDASSFLYVCYYREKALGQVRFDIDNDRAVISISVAKEFRGQGLSTEMLERAMEYFNLCSGYRLFYAEVKNDNLPSQKLFLKAGFCKTEDDSEELIKKFMFQIK